LGLLTSYNFTISVQISPSGTDSSTTSDDDDDDKPVDIIKIIKETPTLIKIFIGIGGVGLLTLYIIIINIKKNKEVFK